MPPPTSLASTLTSSLILSSFGLASKAFLRWGCRDVKVEGLGKLLKALEEEPKSLAGSSGSGTGLVDEKEGEEAGRRGVVTICNHTSVVDDPMVSLCLGHFIPFCSERVASR
jgi:monolysocardiolipin acyltransferase